MNLDHNTECETASTQRTRVAYIYLARRVAAAYGVLYLTLNGSRLHGFPGYEMMHF